MQSIQIKYSFNRISLNIILKHKAVISLNIIINDIEHFRVAISIIMFNSLKNGYTEITKQLYYN